MSQTSTQGEYERLEAESYAEYEPVSAGRAWIVRDNLLHLIDEFCQHRICWARDADSLSGAWAMYLNTGDADEVGVWSACFPLTWLAKGRPANLAYRIEVRGDASFNVDVRTRVIPHFRPGTLTPWGALDAGAGPYAVASTSDTAVALTAASSTVIANGIALFDADTVTQQQMAAARIDAQGFYGIDESGEHNQLFMMMMRLEVEIRTSQAAAGVYFDLIELREFA